MRQTVAVGVILAVNKKDPGEGDKLKSLYWELQRRNKMLMEKCKRVTTGGQNFSLDNLEEALTKNNDVFETFKLEIEKMAKSLKDLKKEDQFLKRKSEKSDVVHMELIDQGERKRPRENVE